MAARLIRLILVSEEIHNRGNSRNGLLHKGSKMQKETWNPEFSVPSIQRTCAKSRAGLFAFYVR